VNGTGRNPLSIPFLGEKGGDIGDAISNLKFQIASPEVKLGGGDHPYGWQA